MPSLMSFGRGHTTGIDLSANAFWRLLLTAASPTEMGLGVMYPPIVGMPANTNKLILARVDVRIAKDADEIENVAKTALSQGTLDLDIARTTEAMNLFKMHQHVGDKAFEEALGSVLELVRVYWQVRQWLEAPDEGKAPFMVDINGWRIKAKP